MSKESLLRNTLKEQSVVLNFIDKVITIIGGLYFFLLPLSYTTITTEFTEYAKLALTLFVASALVLFWGLRILVSRKVMVLHTPLNTAFILVVVALLITTVFSVSPFVSLFGQFNVWHFTLPEILAFVLVFFGLVSINEPAQALRKYLTGLLVSTSLVSGIIILNYLNVFDRFVSEDSALNMFSILSVDGFSPAGNTVSTWYVLGVSIVLLFTLLRKVFANDTAVAAIIPTLTSMNAMKALIGVFFVLHVGALVLTASAHIPGLSARYAAVNQISMSDSWRIASSTVRDRVWFGTGPSTYNTAYNAYRPSQINQTEDWATVYHRSGSEFLTWMTTTGMIGFAAFVFLVGKLLFGAVSAVRTSISRESTQLPYDGTGVLKLRGSLTLLVILMLLGFVFTSSTVMMFGMLFMVIILWMLLERLDSERNAVSLSEISFGTIINNINVEKNERPSNVPAIPLITGLLFIVVAVLVGWYVRQDAMSNVAYARSIQYIGENRQALDIYNAQREAINYNPRRDAYRRAYANTNITTARVVAAEQGENLTDTQRNDILQLIQQSLREVRITTELLNPYSAVNWQTRGRVYQSLLGVAAGADRWALQAFQQAVVLAPQDPQLRVDLGGLYFGLATTTPIEEGTQGEAPDENVPTVPETQQANLLRAISVFQDAARLKPDFATAHFNLALAYKEAGRNDLALQEFETTKSLLTEGSADYNRTAEEIQILQDAGVTPAVTPTPAQTVTPAPTAAVPTVQPTNTPVPTVTPAQ